MGPIRVAFSSPEKWVEAFSASRICRYLAKHLRISRSSPPTQIERVKKYEKVVVVKPVRNGSVRLCIILKGANSYN